MGKQCNRCLIEKELDDFFNDKCSSDGKYSICKVCKKAATYKWRVVCRETYNAGMRAWRKNHPKSCYKFHIKRRYGLTHEQYDAMYTEQGGKCFLCGALSTDAKQRNKKLAVDHCHKSGKVRKLLCDNCNKGLGCFQDNPELLIRAAEYLKL